MENKDVDQQKSSNPEGSSELSEAAPLVTEEQKATGTNRRDMLLKLAAEISGLSLEPLEVSSTTAVAASTPDPDETAIQVPSSNSEGEDKSGASTDAEQTEAPETVAVGETSGQPPTEPNEIIESNATTQSSSTESAMRARISPLFDRTMWLLLWEIILLPVPISMAYYSIKYVRGCDDGEMLSLLLIIVAFITFLTLVARILVNAYKKLDRFEENQFPEPILVAADGLSAFLFLAEMIYFFTIDKEHCNEDFYTYVFFVNNVAIGVMALALFLKCKQHFTSSCSISAAEQ